MAYPAIAAPYGFIPINLIGGQPFAGSTRHFAIASAATPAIFFGDPVKIVAGNVAKDVGTTTLTPVGIFLGVTYSDPTFGKVFRQYYPSGTVAPDIRAYVADDPDILFKVAVVGAGGLITTTGVTRSAIGKNASIIQTAGNPVTGNSAIGALETVGTAATLPLRIVDVVLESALPSGNFTEVICKWNATMHAYNNATGV